jgi:hypothetical protein
MATITVLTPVGEQRLATLAVPPLPADLRGLTVGFVDNTKHNFDLLAQEIGALLKERFGVKAVVHRRKANASTAASDEIIEGLAKDCDLVFAGSGD